MQFNRLMVVAVAASASPFCSVTWNVVAVRLLTNNPVSFPLGTAPAVQVNA